MKYAKSFLVVMFACCSMLLLDQSTNAQSTTQEITGTIIGLNGEGVRTASFTLRIKSLTSDEQANQNRAILQEGGQDKLFKAIQKEDVGTFSVNNQLARTINVVRESQVDDKKRIVVVFERWLQFAEIRGGYRSLDYPFGIIELLVDEKTGKGEGTYIAAAHIRWEMDKKTNQHKVDIENFATYPAKLTNVKVKIVGGAH
jgi:hypothetical protein